jgi:hypothetical protein
MDHLHESNDQDEFTSYMRERTAAARPATPIPQPSTDKQLMLLDHLDDLPNQLLAFE